MQRSERDAQLVRCCDQVRGTGGLMTANDVAFGEPFIPGDACAGCGEPVLDVSRGVIHRRLLYHSPCWLQMQTSAAECAEAVITTQSS